MLMGAIIGAVVGLLVTMIMLSQRNRRKKAFLTALNSQGPEAARAFLDSAIKPRAKMGVSHILDQRERMAGLALLGDVQAIEAEHANHTGPLTAEVQVGAIALLGVALRSDDPRDAAGRLDALATRFEGEGGRMMALVKKKTRAMAAVAAGLTGKPVPREMRDQIASMASGETPLVKLCLYAAMARAIEAIGGDAGHLWRMVREHTHAFDG